MAAPAFDNLMGLLSAYELPGDVYGCRHERKLAVSPEIAGALRHAVAAHVPPERFVAGRLKTLIHSIYFDTADFALYDACLAGGDATNLKIRLRSYGDAATPGRPDAARFLEAKLNVTVPTGARLKQKARMRVGDRKIAKLLDPTGARFPRSRRKLWSPLLDAMAQHQIRPRLTVAYEREAFQSPDGRLRVTFDTGYKASVVGGGASPLARPPAALDDRVIVEIKFIDEIPGWLSGTLLALDLPVEGQGFSKFKTAVPLLFP